MPKTITIDVNGQSGHGSRPHEIKTHAIKKAYEVIDILEILNNKWHKKLQVSSRPRIYVNKIQAGSSNTPNQFPGKCSIEIKLFATKAELETAQLDLRNALKTTREATLITPTDEG